MELLIVVVVIAILASITIVSYNGIQARAIKASAMTDLRNAVQTIEIQQAESGSGSYPSHSPYPKIKLSKDIYTTGRNNWYYCLAQDGKSFAFGVVVSNTGYIMSSSRGLINASSAMSGRDVCGTVGWPASMSDPEPPFGSGYLWNFSTNSGTWNANIN